MSRNKSRLSRTYSNGIMSGTCEDVNHTNVYSEIIDNTKVYYNCVDLYLQGVIAMLNGRFKI
jgi:hypothetical protein